MLEHSMALPEMGQHDCVESAADFSNVSFHAYQCPPGGTARLSGVCEYDFIQELVGPQVECAVIESSMNASHGGNCEIDVDTCISNPCSAGTGCLAFNFTHVSANACWRGKVLSVELLSPAGGHATGFEARTMADSGSTATSLDVRGFAGVSNAAGLEVSGGQVFGAINAPEVYLVPPPPSSAWVADSVLVDDRPMVLSPWVAAVESESCLNGGVWDWEWLEQHFVDVFGCI